MPCRSEGPPSPSTEQVYNKETLTLLKYVLSRVSFVIKMPLPKESEYQNTDMTTTLCAVLRRLKPEDFDAIVYNAKDSVSRRLADWWEQHQEIDKRREIALAKESEFNEFWAGLTAPQQELIRNNRFKI